MTYLPGRKMSLSSVPVTKLWPPMVEQGILREEIEVDIAIYLGRIPDLRGVGG